MQHLQTALHWELLVANLDQQDYINVVFGDSLDNMASCFARYCNETLEIRKLRSTRQENMSFP